VTTAIDRIEAGGIRTSDGVLHKLDVMVFATGFNPHELFRPMQVIRRDGRSLNEVWTDGNEAYRGVSVAGFPNFFMLGGPNSPIGNFSFIMTAERQLDYVLQLITRLQSGEAREISAKTEPTAAYNASVKKRWAARSGRPDARVGTSTRTEMWRLTPGLTRSSSVTCAHRRWTISKSLREKLKTSPRASIVHRGVRNLTQSFTASSLYLGHNNVATDCRVKRLSELLRDKPKRTKFSNRETNDQTYPEGR